MPGRFSHAEVQTMLNNRFGQVAIAAPPTSYLVGLSSTQPANDGTGATEPTGGGYSRVTVANSTTNFPTISGTSRQKTNGVAISFPTATADWGVLPYVVFYDTSGVMRAWGTVTGAGGGAPAAVLSGAVASFAAGTILIGAPA